MESEMHLEFFAKKVIYSDAMDQEIEQAIFQEYPDPEVDYSVKNTPMVEPIKYVEFSASYEFPPYATKVEWCDGEDWGGREQIKDLHLSDTKLKLMLVNGDTFQVGFTTDEVTLKNIKRFLLKSNIVQIL